MNTSTAIPSTTTVNGITTEPVIPSPPPTTVKPLPTIPDYGPNSIEISNLTFSYRSTDSSSSYSNSNSTSGNDSNDVLKDMNLTLPTGSRCLLIGANGSGKSVCYFYIYIYAIRRCVSL
jgi:ABC-type multidrug transport system fused ATPase/permease subunit